MSAARPIEEQLHAFIDGELDPAGMAEIEAQLAADPALAARVAEFRADKERLAAIFGPVAAQALPAAWVRRIESASDSASSAPRRPAARPLIAAIAAIFLLALVGSGAWRLTHPADTILAEAAAAHDGSLLPARELDAPALADAEAVNRLLQDSAGLKIRAPDLTRFGYRLAAVDIFRPRFAPPAVGLVYRNARMADLTIYVRHSAGTPRFDLLRRGKLRVCIWQDELVGAVLTGDMSAGEMMRVASRAYADLNI